MFHKTTTVSWKTFPEYQTMLTSCKTPETYATYVAITCFQHYLYSTSCLLAFSLAITIVSAYLGYRYTQADFPIYLEKVMNTSEFATNLESLTKIIQGAGCKPILVTSLARRVFASEYVPTDILGPYSNETINVAAKLKLPVSLLYKNILYDTYVTAHTPSSSRC